MKDILFANNNSKVLKDLARADLKAHKLKTFLTGIIIFIAVCLLSIICSVLMNDMLTRANDAPYHAVYRSVKENVKTALLNHPDFEAAGVFKNFGQTADPTGSTNIAYMDAAAMEFSSLTISAGRCPAEENEAAVSSAYLKNHKLSIGDSFTFSYTDAFTNKQTLQQFTVCGILSNEKQEKRKQFYILTSDRFREAYADRPEAAPDFSYSTQTPSTVDIAVRLDSESDNLSSEGQKELLRNTGLELGMKSYDIILNTMYIDGLYLDPAAAAGLLLFVLFLMFAGSFVIYGIFYISIINSIRMYAQMMSLGTTGKQLRYFLKKQGNILSIRFIPFGMAFSLLLTVFISGTDWIFYDIIITAVSGLLVYAVVKTALIKPSGILASLSPVEAMKYTGGGSEKHKVLKQITPFTLARNNLSVNSRKSRISVISLSISGTLMIALGILIGSVDLSAMLLQSYPLGEDFQIGIQMDNFYERFPQIIRDNPLSDKLINEITAIPGVEKVIKDECIMGELLYPEIHYENIDDQTELIEGISPELVAHVSETVSGSINLNDIGTDGIIINKYRTDRSPLNYREIQAGDTMLFRFHTEDGTDGAAEDKVTEKTFRVAGIAYFPSTGLFYTSPDILRSISSFNNTSHLSIFCTGNSLDTVKEQLQNIIEKNPNLTLKVYQEEYTMIKNYLTAAANSLYAVFAFIIIFGLLNMLNILISSAIIRKREFALLQAVGMTDGQLRKMLYLEGMSISIKSSAIAVILGIACGRLLCFLASEIMSFKFIHFQVSVWPIVIFAVSLTGLQLIISSCICKSMERNTVTEQLRAE